MAKFRIQFTKYGDMKYVSHLDMIRLFTRIFKRAELPLAYSAGFNPHPKMSVLLPLSVGFESDSEYLDVELSGEVSMLDCIKKLRASVPIGMEIPEICSLNETSIKPKEIRYAGYEFCVDTPVLSEKLEEFLNLAEVVVVKKTKRSEGETDIKNDILDVCYIDENRFSAIISAGSEANLKPDLLITAMKKYIDGFCPEDITIKRTAIMTERGEKMM